MSLKSGAVVLVGCLAIMIAITGRARAAGYVQTNLVTDGSDPAVTAPTIDPHLVNPWGISFFPGMSPFWVSDNNAGVTTLYDGMGVQFPAPADPLVVEIPLPGGKGEPPDNEGAPTGQVANIFAGTGAFPIVLPGPTNTGPALFIFATEDGTIAAWSETLPEPDGDAFTIPGVTSFSDDATIQEVGRCTRGSRSG
jgi:uncharacterized protein (TIGR03118 family)